MMLVFSSGFLSFKRWPFSVRGFLCFCLSVFPLPRLLFGQPEEMDSFHQCKCWTWTLPLNLILRSKVRFGNSEGSLLLPVVCVCPQSPAGNCMCLCLFMCSTANTACVWIRSWTCSPFMESGGPGVLTAFAPGPVAEEPGAPVGTATSPSKKLKDKWNHLLVPVQLCLGLNATFWMQAQKWREVLRGPQDEVPLL